MDMNCRNSVSKKTIDVVISSEDIKDVHDVKDVKDALKKGGRKKRSELSISATKSIKKETIEVVVCFQ